MRLFRIIINKADRYWAIDRTPEEATRQALKFSGYRADEAWRASTVEWPMDHAYLIPCDPLPVSDWPAIDAELPGEAQK